MAYSVTVFLGNGDGIFVRPLLEQSTTTPDDEQEHSAGQSLASLPPALTNNFELVENTTIHKHKIPKIALIFISYISFSFGFIFVVVFAHICLLNLKRV